MHHHQPRTASTFWSTFSAATVVFYGPSHCRSSLFPPIATASHPERTCQIRRLLCPRMAFGVPIHHFQHCHTFRNAFPKEIVHDQYFALVTVEQRPDRATIAQPSGCTGVAADYRRGGRNQSVQQRCCDDRQVCDMFNGSGFNGYSLCVQMRHRGDF